MTKSYIAGYALIATVVLGTFGVRVVTLPERRPAAIEPDMVAAGEVLFKHDWTPHDPLCASGDGLGPVYNATSCVACHKQGGVGGAGGLEHNVTVFVLPPRAPRERPRQGVVHAHAVKFRETLKDVDPNLPAISQPPLSMMLPQRLGGQQPRFRAAALNVHLSQRNTPALFGARLIDEIPDSVIIAGERVQRLRWAGASAEDEGSTVGRALRLADGRVGHFGWKAQSASLSDFVRAACAGELGLSNPGQDQPAPISKPDYKAVGLDLTAQQCDQMTTFVASLPRPVERSFADADKRRAATEGKDHFHAMGCADCHTPQVGAVAGIYSDLLMHRMGQELEGSGSYNRALPGVPESPSDDTFPDEWRTPPLWGVADSGPWLHDGRAATLEEAIRQHAGQALRSAHQFSRAGPTAQAQVIAFLESLRAP